MKITKTRLREIIKEELDFISEKEDKVGKKIAYLMDKENKPQDQAVAIALNMKERVELEEEMSPERREYHRALTLLSNVVGKVTPLRAMGREILLDPLDVDDLEKAFKYFKAAQPLSQE